MKFLFETISLDSAVELICESTPAAFRRATKQTERFLYRGVDDQSIHIENPLADLLIPGTYEDKDALAYFQYLEDILPVECRPSIGHVATSNSEEAANWGEIASVWPLGKRISYVWPKDRELIFPYGENLEEEMVINKSLEGALLEPREVLFASSGISGKMLGVAGSTDASPFLCVPKELDMALLSKLKRRNFGFYC